MTRVSILVPHGTVLLNSVVSLFNIFNRANDHAAERGREVTFEMHLVGIASHADLYGGRFLIKPDRKLVEVAATDLVIIPAMAGNIAEGIRNNSAFIPWIKKQYRAGAEIAGLCTGAFFIADTGLIHDKHCSSHWFVEAAFRKQYPQVNLLAEKTAIAGGAIHSNGGAWSFIQVLLERIAGREAALACSASFQTPFNRECQSIVTISDARKQQANRTAKKNRLLVHDNSMQQMTMERFASMFQVTGGEREGSLTMANALEECMQIPVVNGDPTRSGALFRNENEGRAENNNRTTFRALFKKIAGVERSYGNNG